MLQPLKDTLSRRELFRWSALLTAPALFRTDAEAGAATPRPPRSCAP